MSEEYPIYQKLKGLKPHREWLEERFYDLMDEIRREGILGNSVNVRELSKQAVVVVELLAQDLAREGVQIQRERLRSMQISSDDKETVTGGFMQGKKYDRK